MADVYRWNGFSGAFNDPHSWTDLSSTPGPTTPAGPPGVEDTAEFITNGTATGNGDVNSLSVIGASMVFTGNITAETFSAGNEGVVIFTGGADINVDGGGLLISDFSGGIVQAATVFGGFVDVQYSDLHVEFQGDIDLTQGTGNFTVGEPQFTDIPSTFELDFGGSVTDVTGVLGGTSGASASVDGGVWTSTNGLAIGTAGSGSLDISLGGVVSTGSSGALTVGLANGTSGTVTVSGGASTLLSNYTSDVVGGLGSGAVTLGAAGTFTVAGTLDVGAGAGGSGTIVAAASGATLSVGSALIIGDGGSGVGTIAAGSSASVSNGLTLGSQSGGAGTLTVTDAGTQLSVGGGEVIGGAGSGALVVQSGGAVLLNSGSVVVGAGAGGSGTVTVDGSSATLGVGNGLTIGAMGTGALALLSGATIGLGSGTLDLGTGLDANGTVALSGVGSALMLAAGPAIIGDAGTGTLSVGAADSVTTAQDVTIAAGSVSVGLLSVSGVGAGLADGGNLVVGEGGDGELIVQSSGSVGVSAGSLVVGDATGSTGDVELGSSLAVGQGITVGNQGFGALDLLSSAALALASGTIDIGEAVGGSGTLALAAASGVTLAAPGVVVVGDSGTGLVTVGAGDSLDVGSDTLNIGVAGSGIGTVVVTGTNAMASLDGLVVGNAGHGTLAVGAGAQVTTLDDIVIGAGAGATGLVTVNGAGALLDDGAGLTIGAAGSGEIDINQGSISVFSGVVTLGVSVAASGSLSLQNSTLDLSGSLVVGAAGSGSLAVGAGGTLQAQDLALGAQGGSAGSVSVSGAGALLDATVLAVGGSDGAAGGTGRLSVGAGGTVAGDAVTVWSGGTIALDGGVVATGTLTIDGEVTGFGTLGGILIDDGTILADGGTLLLGGLGGSGTLAFGDPATLVLSAPGSALGMPVTGLNNGDRIELAGITITGAQVTSPGTVTVTTTGPTYELTAVTFAPGALQTFTTGTDPTTGDAYIQVACFAAGTHIAAARGEVAVEALCVGDHVALAEGGTAEVIWIGRRTVDATRHPAPQKIWPVRVAAGAFGAASPRRDLLLSPDHAVFIENVLIPIRYLINGSTIAQEKVDRIEYYHIELPRHDVVLAEGLPVESYLHTGDRSDFANGGGVVRLYPDFNVLAWEALGYARLVVIGPELDAARARIAAVAVHHSSRHRNSVRQCA